MPYLAVLTPQNVGVSTWNMKKPLIVRAKIFWMFLPVQICEGRAGRIFNELNLLKVLN